MPVQAKVSKDLTKNGKFIYHINFHDAFKMKLFFPKRKTVSDQLKILAHFQTGGVMDAILRNMYIRLAEDVNWGNTPAGKLNFQLADGVWTSIPGVTHREDLTAKIQSNLG